MMSTMKRLKGTKQKQKVKLQNLEQKGILSTIIKTILSLDKAFLFLDDQMYLECRSACHCNILTFAMLFGRCSLCDKDLAQGQANYGATCSPPSAFCGPPRTCIKQNNSPIILVF